MTCLSPAIGTGVVMCVMIWLFITQLYLPYDAAYKDRIMKYKKAQAQVASVCDNPDVMLALEGHDDCPQYRATLLESPRDEAIKIVMYKYDYACGAGGCFALSVNWFTLFGLILPAMTLIVILIVIYVAVVAFRMLARSSDLPSWTPTAGKKQQRGHPYTPTNAHEYGGLTSIIVDALRQRTTGPPQ